MGRETGWLIEHEDHKPRHRWLRAIKYSGDMKGTVEWTEDANLALRFGRRDDAVNFAWLFPDFCTLALITEHIFDDGAAHEPRTVPGTVLATLVDLRHVAEASGRTVSLSADNILDVLGEIEGRDKRIAQLEHERAEDMDRMERAAVVIEDQTRQLNERAAPPPGEDRALALLTGLVRHWNEFGPDDGLDEKMHYAGRWLDKRTASSPEHRCGVEGFNQMLGDVCPACSTATKGSAL